MRARTTLAVVGAFILGAAGAAGTTTALASSPAPAPAATHKAMTTGGDWHGFTTGDVIVCPGSQVETDHYEPGDDPALPHGGWWAHCDGDAYIGNDGTDVAQVCAGTVLLLDDARHSPKNDQPEGLDDAVEACSDLIGGF